MNALHIKYRTLHSQLGPSFEFSVSFYLLFWQQCFAISLRRESNKFMIQQLHNVKFSNIFERMLRNQYQARFFSKRPTTHARRVHSLAIALRTAERRPFVSVTHTLVYIHIYTATHTYLASPHRCVCALVCV